MADRPIGLECSDPGPLTEFGAVPCDACPECLAFAHLVDMRALQDAAAVQAAGERLAEVVGQRMRAAAYPDPEVSEAIANWREVVNDSNNGGTK